MLTETKPNMKGWAVSVVGADDLRWHLDEAVRLAAALGYPETHDRAVNARARVEIDAAHAAGRGSDDGA